MRFIVPLCSALLLLLSHSASAWQLTLTNDSDGTAQVAVKNELSLKDVAVYLVWFNLDNGGVQSWSMTDGWQADVLNPIASQAFAEVKPFAQQNVTTLPALCDSEERCFLALVATPAAADVLDSSQWQASAVLPLSVKAGQERLPGQQFFLSPELSDRFATDDVAFSDDLEAPTMNEAAPSSAPEADKAEAEDGAAPSTEKPDIFRLVGDRLYYANGQAEKFQMIDVSNPSQPRLVTETRLTGSPLELYVLTDYIVLMQNNNENYSGKTVLTVFQLQADNMLHTVEEMQLDGQFIESRRRGQVIYAALNLPYNTESELDAELAQLMPVDSESVVDCVECGPQQTMLIKALTLSAEGQLTLTDQALLRGYSPKIAIFQDYLILASQSPYDWRTNLVQGFLLTDPLDPLVPFDTIQVPGRIPSEFHLHIKDQQLRVVYGPSDRNDGSHLAIFDLSQQTPTLLGKVEKIAPGEDLFATRFVGDKAFIVTYERTDPLWVIDLSTPSNPHIIGELHVPGWSEKLFFYEDRLFAVGIHDVPGPNEDENQRVRRVAMSLFDVSDPTHPSLINRVVPLEGEVNWSYSEALEDERALLLDWQQSYAALPISSWESEAGNYLQIVSFADGTLKEAGRVSSLVNLRRSVELAPNTLAALGDQSLMTVQWGNGAAQVLAQLELAVNLSWMTANNGSFWAAARGDKGFFRLYHYAPDALERATRTVDLPRGYDTIALGQEHAVFYNWNPLAFQAMDLASGQLLAAQAPTAEEETGDYYYWRQRSNGFVANGAFHIGEKQSNQSMEPGCGRDEICILPVLEVLPEKPPLHSSWVLKSWPLTGSATAPVTRSIPGEPVGFTPTGQLITQEVLDNQVRLNLLTLTASSANLVSSTTLECTRYQAQFYLDEETLWLSCPPAQRYYIQAPEADTEAKTMTTQMYRLDPLQQFAVTGQWTLPQSRHLFLADENVVMLQTNSFYYYDYPIMPEPGIAFDVMPARPFEPVASEQCEIMRLGPEGSMTTLAKRDYCPSANQAALQSNQLVITQGFAGFEVMRW